MDRDAYQQFTADLIASVTDDDDVLGLVALGSMAELDGPGGHGPDEWSDHDLFLITREGQQPRYRGELSWLPDSDTIAWWYQETEHGLKVVYEGGHLVELAVFSLDEIALSRVNRHRVLLDRADVGSRMAAVAARTARELADHAPRLEWVINQLLGDLLVAALRGGRGETLSARSRLLAAVRWFCVAWARGLDPKQAARLDTLDPLRRIEQTAPRLANGLHRVCTAPIPSAVTELLTLAETELSLDEAQRRAALAICKHVPQPR